MSLALQAQELGATPPASPPMFRATVELLSMTCVLALTEDRSVTKRILCVGSSRRQPRRGDVRGRWSSRARCEVVTFSYGQEAEASSSCTVALGEALRKGLLGGRGQEPLPFRGLYHVLLSMKEEERSLVRLSSSAAQREGEEQEVAAPRRPDLRVLVMVSWHLK